MSLKSWQRRDNKSWLFRLSIWLLFVVASDHSNVASAAPPADLQPLYRFHNSASNQHSYAHKHDELAAWRSVPTVLEHKAIGLVATRRLQGTVPLHRAFRETNQRHFYYTATEAIHRNVTVDRENFSVYVWTSEGDGRIPIYGSTGSDGTDVFLDGDLQAVLLHNSNEEKTGGSARRFKGETPLFYVYPLEPVTPNTSLDLGKMRIAGGLPSNSRPTASQSSQSPAAPSNPSLAPASDSSRSSSTDELADLIERCERSVVRIETQGAESSGLGSGFVVAAGLIATNVHVLAGAQEATATFPDGNRCTIVGTMYIDESRDIAIARVVGDIASVPHLPIVADLPRKGSSVVALGSPLGLSFTATSGVVSAVRNADELRRELGRNSITGTWIQLDAALSPGNSGGPIIDRNGGVVAMSTLASTGAQNLNFGISAVDIRQALDQVKLDKMESLAKGVGQLKPNTNRPASTGPSTEVSEVPGEAIDAYIARGRELFPALKRDLTKEVARLRQNLSAMRTGQTSLPENLRRRGGVPDVIRGTDPNRRNAVTWYFRNEVVKQEVVEEVTNLVKELQQLSQQLKDANDPSSLLTLLTKFGPPIDTREVGSVGFISSATVLHSYNDHDVLVTIDDAIYLMHLESTAGLTIGRETLPKAYFVRGTSTANLPDGISMAVTVLQAVSNDQLKQQLSKQASVSEAGDGFKIWKDATGKFSIEAKLVAITDDVATLQRRDGKEIRVPIAKLSQESQEQIKP